MATTTTNFGWDIPQSTDLVKDGATAIAALGQDIDTAFVDLKGGTTGQILAKASATDLDYSWTDVNPGDITSVTAGTGISGGGTSGAVTVTNSMATAIDAKGDLVVGTGADTFSRLAVGTNAYVLTADSAETTGLKWGALTQPGLVKISDNSFTTASSVSINSNFTSTYRNYKIILQITSSSATANLRMRFRASGSDDTNANYNSVIAGFRFDGSQYTPGGANATSFFFGDLNSSNTDTYFSADIVAPQLAQRSGVLGCSVGRDATGGFAGTGGGYFANTTQFDGLTWYPASGTITGKLLVFGYLND